MSFYFYLSAFVSLVLNLSINSAIRSVAPSGGFSTYFFFFPFLSFDYFISLYSFTSLTEFYEGLGELSITEDYWLCLEEFWLSDEVWLMDELIFELEDCCWEVLFWDEILDLELLKEVLLELSWGGCGVFLLKLEAVVFYEGLRF